MRKACQNLTGISRNSYKFMIINDLSSVGEAISRPCLLYELLVLTAEMRELHSGLPQIRADLAATSSLCAMHWVVHRAARGYD